MFAARAAFAKVPLQPFDGLTTRGKSLQLCHKAQSSLSIHLLRLRRGAVVLNEIGYSIEISSVSSTLSNSERRKTTQLARLGIH